MNTFQKTMFTVVLTTAGFLGFAAKVEALPAGVTCTKHHVGGHDCFDNCTKNGAKITGSYHHDGLWHDGSCLGGAIVIRSPLTAKSKDNAIIKGATGLDMASPEKNTVPTK
jgi:hypothetical protein